ncbi:MAG: cupin domain-containing protein [Bacteroidales bacterium]|nr:cupin domain-containing protein [Bacteroidales bacterium]MBD5221402.1 cupin domain-containing protein [Bacteroidales bacterium]
MFETNYQFGEVNSLVDQIKPETDHVQFKNVFSNDNGGVVLVAFKAGQSLDTHIAPVELMVNVLEGEIEFTMNGVSHTLRGGEFLLMGADVPHSVKAKAESKMMLVKVKP